MECSWENKMFEYVYKQKTFDVLSSFNNNSHIKCEAKDIAYYEEEKEIDESDTVYVEDGIFQCTKCNSKKTTYYSLQTRSADEPMTNFVTCVTCKHKWKM